eukprot:PhF_6_TR31835/c0_g2_i1/m.47097/K01768/E4.6.1.1; adenylate cyclase
MRALTVTNFSTVVVVVMILVTSGIVLAVTITGGRKVVEDLAVEYLESFGRKTQTYFGEYLTSVAKQLNSTANTFKWQWPVCPRLSESVTNKSLEIGSVEQIWWRQQWVTQFANTGWKLGHGRDVGFEDGTYYDVSIDDPAATSVCTERIAGYFPKVGSFKLYYSVVTRHDGTILNESYLASSYDARKRPWYAFNKVPTWMGSYTLAVSPTTYLWTGYNVGLWDAAGTKCGNLGITINAEELNDILRQSHGQSDLVSILLSPDGRLIASTSAEPFIDQVVLTKEEFMAQAGPNVTRDPKCVYADVALGAVNYKRICFTWMNTYSNRLVREYSASVGSMPPPDGLTTHKLMGGNYYIMTTTVTGEMANVAWKLIIFFPQDRVLSGINNAQELSIILSVVWTAVGMVASILVMRFMLKPLGDVARDMDMLADLEFPEKETKRSSLYEVGKVQQSLDMMSHSLHSFSKYVPLEVVKELMKTGAMATLSMAPTVATISFTDIAKFTNICQHLDSKTLVELVSLYFEVMTDIVMAFGGVVDKFIGDCVMALWGTPKLLAGHTIRACAAALTMKYATKTTRLRRVFARAHTELDIRTGIHEGTCLAGNLGTQRRLNYTVIGDTVNLAARLEAMNKDFGTAIMVSEDVTRDWEHDYLVLRLLGNIMAVGRDAPTRVYELVGVRSAGFNKSTATIIDDDEKEDEIGQHVLNLADYDAKDEAMFTEFKTISALPEDEIIPRLKLIIGIVSTSRDEFCAQYTRAVQLYLKRDFAQALEIFKSFDNLRPIDQEIVDEMKNECIGYISKPPGPEWCGIKAAKHK